MSLHIGRLENVMVIDVEVDGTIHSMYRENVMQLDFLGKQSVRRASDLIFNDERQSFAIHLAEGSVFLPPVPEAQDFPTYEAARDMEVRWLEMARLHDVHPASTEGRCLLSHLRAELPVH